MKLFVPKSTWRYSALRVHCGIKNHSMPPPTVHPVMVPPLDAALVVPEAAKVIESEKVGFANASAASREEQTLAVSSFGEAS